MSEAPVRGHKRKREMANETHDNQMKHAFDGTEEPVHPPLTAAFTAMSAHIAGTPTMLSVPAQASPRRSLSAVPTVQRPRYLLSLYWNGHKGCVSRLVTISEQLPPLPRVPTNELQNDVVTNTITDHAHLFQIITPLNVEHLEALLINHPNPTFVTSILHGLREGFWPWADTRHNDYPITQDYYQPRSFEPHIEQFLRDQRDDEICLGQFSESFPPTRDVRNAVACHTQTTFGQPQTNHKP
jgi:hypothetical protein